MEDSMLLKLDHLYTMTDDTGIIQHSKYAIPDLATGYTTDDNARALIIAAMLYHRKPNQEFLQLINRYLAFLHFGQKNNGKWKNFMNYQRKFIENEGSEDSFGRSLWSLGFVLSLKNIPNGISDVTKYLYNRALQNVKKLTFIRAKAYSIIGLSFAQDSILEDLADELIQIYMKNKTPDWKWFEDEITYANGVLPYALFKAYEVKPKKEYIDVGIETLAFLDELVMKKGYLKLIGCNGWAEKDGIIARFDEQPVDAADMVLAYAKAYELTGQKEYLQKAQKSFEWFLGENCHGLALINPENGGCYDGLTKDGLNYNQGAESQFAYIVSYLTIDFFRTKK
jgi:hypothetical protein